MNRLVATVLPVALCALFGCGGVNSTDGPDIGVGRQPVRAGSFLVEGSPSSSRRALVPVTDPDVDATALNAASSPTMGPPAVPLVIHGPVAVSAEQFAQSLGPRTPPAQVPLSLHEYFATRANHLDGTGLAPSVACNCDPQFSASQTNAVGICSQDIAFFSLFATPIGEPPSSPTPIAGFFAPLASVAPSNSQFFDNRVLYDGYRQRFWVTSMVIPPSGSGLNPKILFAVSKTADATGGWYYYWFIAAAPADANNSIDYDQIGISKDRFLVTNDYDDPTRGGWVPIVSSIDANIAAGGGSLTGWQWYGLKNPDGSYASYPVPARSHNTSTVGAYLVGHYGPYNLLVWTLPGGDTTPSQITNRAYPIYHTYNGNALVDADQPYETGLRATGPGAHVDGLQGDEVAFRFGRLAVAWHETTDLGHLGVELTELDTSTHTTTFDYWIYSDTDSFSYPSVDIESDAKIGLGWSESSNSVYPSIDFEAFTSGGSGDGDVLTAYQGNGPDDYDGARARRDELQCGRRRNSLVGRRFDASERVWY
jgi:hypothetical protein